MPKHRTGRATHYAPSRRAYEVWCAAESSWRASRGWATKRFSRRRRDEGVPLFDPGVAFSTQSTGPDADLRASSCGGVVVISKARAPRYGSDPLQIG